MSKNQKAMPVQVGLYSFMLKSGMSINIDKKGHIFLVGSRGKRTDTGKNLYDKPVTFSNNPLPGDIQAIKYTMTKPYHQGKQTVHPIFALWKSVLGLADGIKFKKYSDESGNTLFRAMIGETALIALSANPDKLVYIEVNKQRYFELAGGPAKDIPLTAEYVIKCEKSYRDLMTEAQKKRTAELETAGLPDRVTEEERLEQQTAAQKHFRMMFGKYVKEAEQLLIKQSGGDKPVISRKSSLMAMGLIAGEAALRKAEDKQDEELNKKKWTKVQLADLAKTLYNRDQMNQSDKIPEDVVIEI